MTELPVGRRQTARVRAVATTALLLASLAGCSPYRFEACPPRLAPALGEMRAGHGVVQLLYATDRRPTGAPQPTLCYGCERARGLAYGVCEVSIPPGHGRGQLEPLVPLPARDPKHHVALLSVEPAVDQAAFLETLREKLAQAPQRDVLVFVHGYAVTFEDATRRTAQIAHDIGFEGVAITYSWPTQGLLLSYLADASNADWTAPYFAELLDLLATETGAEHVHVLAHSMGTRVVARAVKDHVAARALEPPTATRPAPADVAASPARGPAHLSAPPIDQLIFAAADIDAEIFERDYAPWLAAAARRVTIYISTADWALGGARRLHGFSRLGQGDLPNVDLALLIDRIEVVDVTALDRGLIGHLYYAESPDVLRDIAEVLRGRSAAERGLQRNFFYRMK